MDMHRSFMPQKEALTTTDKPKASRFKKFILTVLVLITVFLGGTTYFLSNALGAVAKEAKPVSFEIKQLQGWATIADNLQQENIIRSALAFRLLLRFTGNDLVKAGVYTLDPSWNAQKVLNKLVSGETDEAWVRLPEGWMISQFVESIVKKNIFSKEDLEAALTPSLYSYDFLQNLPDNSLEGFLFPDSYKVPKSYTAKTFVKMVLDNFAKKIAPLKSQIASSSLSLYEVITLASIIEKEASNEKDRKLIAGVFLNRLQQSISLGSCPTILYAIGDWNAPLTAKNLATDSPYNTRLYKGLPPGPISSPSLSSIKAVLEPTQSEYLFFLSKDGVTYYSKTNDEHEALKAKYGVY